MKQRIGTVKYTKAPRGVDEAMKQGHILTLEEEAEHFEVPIEELPGYELRKHLELPPAKLAKSEKHKIRVSILLDNTNIEYFKKLSIKTHTPYQTMINRVLTGYVEQYKDAV
ncbi:MAG: BrnA antitoxin family protein [Spirochaetaceae bacterium]|jgi:predicted DNA binding CopG/RHH family protein|nr:BrnA antitoxin family protein [Spirochaetaceae bacterium]